MIFLDSSFLIAYKIENDTHHQKAKLLMEKIIKNEFGKPIISDYIFDEVITVIFGKSKNHKLAVETGKELINSFDILNIEESLFKESWNEFIKQKETKFSFTDCSILALINSHKIQNLATFDEEFNNIGSLRVFN